MSEPLQIPLTKHDIDRLQRLRASVIAFQNMIAPLPANQYNEGYGEQFNRLRLETEAILKIPEFETYVPPLITKQDLRRREQAALPLVYLSVITGVVIALMGLGLNYIIQNEPTTNTIGCLISTGGTFLVIGSYIALVLVGSRRNSSNLGDIYQRCETLLYQINHALSMAIPSFSTQTSTVSQPNIPTTVDLALGSLSQQVEYWQGHYERLRQEKVRLEPDVSPDLAITVDYAASELKRVKTEMAYLHSEPSADNGYDGGPVKEIALPGGRKISVAKVDDTADDYSIVTPAAIPAADAPPIQKSDTQEFKPITPPPPPESDSTAAPVRVSDETDSPTWSIEEKSADFDSVEQVASSVDTLTVKPPSRIEPTIPIPPYPTDPTQEVLPDAPINQANTIAMPLSDFEKDAPPTSAEVEPTAAPTDITAPMPPTQQTETDRADNDENSPASFDQMLERITQERIRDLQTRMENVKGDDEETK